MLSFAHGQKRNNHSHFQYKKQTKHVENHTTCTVYKNLHMATLRSPAKS